MIRQYGTIQNIRHSSKYQISGSTSEQFIFLTPQQVYLYNYDSGDPNKKTSGILLPKEAEGQLAHLGKDLKIKS